MRRPCPGGGAPPPPRRGFRPLVFLSAVPILLVVVVQLLTLAGPHPPRAVAAPAWGELVTVVREDASPPAGPDSAPALVHEVLTSAEALRGTRYVYGGQRPETGFDCSGFVGYVYGLQGVRLPRTSRAQARAGRAVSADPDAFRPGDLLFFATTGGSVDHVALYAGDGLLLHASEIGGEVREDDLWGVGGGWLFDRLVGVRRIVE